LCPKQKQKYVKELTRRQVATSAEVDSLAEKFEKELFLMACISSIVYEDIDVWFMDNGSSRYMI
jgi:hypothetical protein